MITHTSRFCDFINRNPPTFYGTNVDEDPQSFIAEIFKVVDSLAVTSRERVELATYKLKHMGQVWFKQWRDERPLRDVPVHWEAFKEAFQDMFYPLKLREKKMVEFMNLCQWGTSVKDNCLNFT